MNGFCFSFKVFGAATALGMALTPSLWADDEQTSRREAVVIKAVQDAGGRVSAIAADTDQREVSFFLLGDKITDQHVKNVGTISNVVWLNLAETGITDASVAAIKSLKLEKLHLEKTGIGDAALKSLSDMTTLTYLNLYRTEVTDAGLEHLTKLKNLKKLHLWQTGVTQQGVDKLKESLPDVTVTGLPQPAAPAEETEEQNKDVPDTQAADGKEDAAKADEQEKADSTDDKP